MIGPDLKSYGENKSYETRLLQHTAATVVEMLGITTSTAPHITLALQPMVIAAENIAKETTSSVNRIPQQEK